MKKIVAILFIMAIISGSSLYAIDVDDLNYILFDNTTDNDIEYIFISPADSDYWGPEVLGSEWVLSAGGQLGYFILYPHESDDFDIMVIDSEQNVHIAWDFTISDDEEASLVLTSVNMNDDPVNLSTLEVNIINDVNDIYYLFISPSDSEMWGVDFLDENTILETENKVSFVFPLQDATVGYDLLAIDEEGNAYQLYFEVDETSTDMEFHIAKENLMIE
ncbi:hypothetical protein [Spirochaeta cellobiosiphila]|uniref:hypothetical protein n=1 Tax=Spirochaeta cellobiosiphila TaxID=504483 RepID=UPI00040E6EEC|nr:hypothetical protein [Spirochaeta cellobiosiphila]